MILKFDELLEYIARVADLAEFSGQTLVKDSEEESEDEKE